MHQTLEIATTESKQIKNITDQISSHIPSDFNGIVNIFAKHTTAAISIADLDPGTDQDILDALENIMPDLDFRHPHDPSHVGDHIWSTIISPSTQVPIINGKMQLGTWQNIVLIELNGPRSREIVLTFLKASVV
jgi:secondary thiamine-phosphate synthase enzyme